MKDLMKSFGIKYPTIFSNPFASSNLATLSHFYDDKAEKTNEFDKKKKYLLCLHGCLKELPKQEAELGRVEKKLDQLIIRNKISTAVEHPIKSDFENLLLKINEIDEDCLVKTIYYQNTDCLKLFIEKKKLHPLHSQEWLLTKTVKPSKI